VSQSIAIRPLRPDERAWADAQYAAIQFVASPPDATQLVAELVEAGGSAPVGLGRLVPFAPGVVEMGGIWTADAVRGRGVARAMVMALIERAPGDAPLWCIPFAHLVPFYASCGFVAHAGPWPPAVAAKVAAVEAQGLGPIAVLARPA